MTIKMTRVIFSNIRIEADVVVNCTGALIHNQNQRFFEPVAKRAHRGVVRNARLKSWSKVERVNQL
jgi:hypothetical protein